MDNPIEIAQALKEELDKLPLFQEYSRVKCLLENNEDLLKLKGDIAWAKHNGDNELHKTLLDKYNSHPLVINYQSLQSEVYDYLKQVSDIVNKK